MLRNAVRYVGAILTFARLSQRAICYGRAATPRSNASIARGSTGRL